MGIRYYSVAYFLPCSGAHTEFRFEKIQDARVLGLMGVTIPLGCIDSVSFGPGNQRVRIPPAPDDEEVPAPLMPNLGQASRALDVVASRDALARACPSTEQRGTFLVALEPGFVQEFVVGVAFSDPEDGAGRVYALRAQHVQCSPCAEDRGSKNFEPTLLQDDLLLFLP